MENTYNHIKSTYAHRLWRHGRCGSGAPRIEVLRLFQISAATLNRYLKQQHTIGDLTPHRHSYESQPHITLNQHPAMLAMTMTTANPDATLAETCAQCQAQTAVAASQATMCWHSTISAGRAKKTLAATERDKRLRRGFPLSILQHTADRFMIVDESDYNVNLTPVYARALHGQPAYM